MTAATLDHELHQLGRRLGWWQAEQRGTWWAAAFLGLVALLALLDILLHFEVAGRLASWSVLCLALAALAWQVWRAVAVHRSTEAVAARVEHAFPQLNNRLINFVQFGHAGATDPLREAYLRKGLPEWSGLELNRLCDQRRRAIGYGALGAGLLLVLAPAIITPRAWGNAVLRVLNPFSSRAPSTLATIIEVHPGNQAVTSGRPLTLSCRATGRDGQQVWLDLWPQDDKPVTLALGRLGAATTSDTATSPSAGVAGEEFAHTLAKIGAPLQYRFRAGDARSARFAVTVVPPLALTRLEVGVAPPAYTGLKAQRFNALTESPVVPQGSRVTVSLVANRELAGASLSGQRVTAAEGVWSATVPAGLEKSIPVTVTAADGERLETSIKCQVLPDRAPQIRIIAPAGKTTLAPGATPNIQWEVTDDHRVVKLILEDGNGALLQEWPADGPVVSQAWTGPPLASGMSAAYRVLAVDDLQTNRSALIAFESAGAKEIAKAREQQENATIATLARLVALQKTNLERTRQLAAAVASAKAEQWQGAAAAQTEIRQLTGTLLADARKPLGPLTAVVQEVYRTAMTTVIDLLARVPKAAAAQQPELAGQGIALEARILQVLTSVSESIGRVDEHSRVSGILALLDALVDGQDQVRQATARAATKPPAPATLTQRQDKLAGDLSEFVQACRAEIERVQRSDAEFAALVTKVTDGIQQQQVGAEMLRAAEKLEAKAPAAALPFQDKALAALREFQALLNQWRVSEARDQMTALKQAVAAAADKFEKLVNLQSKVVETMRAVKPDKDLSGPDQEEFMEELRNLKASIKETALKVADDLHIFPELPVGNEVVQDIYTVFEETKQVSGSENEEATELGLQKEDFMLEAMEKIKERFDDMEMWLTAKPDSVKRLTENFDQQEMPKMAVIPLPDEIQDIIGDLLQQQEEIKDKSDDSPTNQAVPDMAMGWDIAEGEWSNFSGKGKSGNEPPEHKDQDGRSIVGRQGMSDGETVAGSGKINKGDEKIENRRTQDSAQAGRVAEEEHAKAVATGGGKLSGYAEETGMPGGGPRRDSNLPGSLLGLQAMLRRNAESLYARSSMLHVRTGALDEAVRAMRDAEQAMADGRPIQQIREHQRRAIAALKQSQADLDAGVAADVLDTGRRLPALADQMAGVPEEAPATYRDLVADYFKSLGAAP